MKDACNWADMQSSYSKVCQFFSLQMVHIKHKGVIFQISELGSLLCHPHNKSKTFSGNTHWTPNILNIKLHNSQATLQWIKRLSTIFHYNQERTQVGAQGGLSPPGSIFFLVIIYFIFVVGPPFQNLRPFSPQST